jgi:hypothetical protein
VREEDREQREIGDVGRRRERVRFGDAGTRRDLELSTNYRREEDAATEDAATTGSRSYGE